MLCHCPLSSTFSTRFSSRFSVCSVVNISPSIRSFLTVDSLVVFGFPLRFLTFLTAPISASLANFLTTRVTVLELLCSRVLHHFFYKDSPWRSFSANRFWSIIDLPSLKSINTFCLSHSKIPQFTIVQKDAVDIVFISMLSLRRSVLKMFSRSLVALIVSDFRLSISVHNLLPSDLQLFHSSLQSFLDMLYSSVLSACMRRSRARSVGGISYLISASSFEVVIHIASIK